MAKVNIHWLGHACFEISGEGYKVVTDPFEDGSVNGIGNVRVKANRVYCSHQHHDHNATQCVDVVLTDAKEPIVTEIMSFHDDAQGTKRGTNIIRVFDFDGVRVAHFGDLGHLLSARQISQIGKVDVALIPAGGFFTIDAKTAREVCDSVNAKVVIPMHYRTDNFGFPVIAHIDDIVKELGDVRFTESSDFAVDENTESGVYILTPSLMTK